MQQRFFDGHYFTTLQLPVELIYPVSLCQAKFAVVSARFVITIYKHSQQLQQTTAYRCKEVDIMNRIKPLDANVVNRIAAGEIIVSPVNALKELLENSIDAGANMVDVLLKDGGLKVLQITDNGSGIHKDDLPILCQRFTTSKLKEFNDLESIVTYGFRGEALASISHIAKVTVTTMTKDDRCAWRVCFQEGKMLDKPAPIAGKQGTTILVEDLFYNVPSRLRSLKSPNDEFNKILDVLSKYAIHCDNIGVSCKKFGTAQFTLTIKPQFTILDRIRNVYGNALASNIIPFKMKLHSNKNADENNDDKKNTDELTTEKDSEDTKNLGLQQVKGQISNLDYNSKRTMSSIIFINNRLVTCDPLRRALYQIYQQYLPKGHKPFIYISLLIKPELVDVNIHPTKREVRFLNQDEIIEKIALQLQQTLMQIDSSRTFKASTILTGSQSINNTKKIASNSIFSNSIHKPTINKAKRYEHNLIRTDSKQAKITTFMKNNQTDLLLKNNNSQSLTGFSDTLVNKRKNPSESLKKLFVPEDAPESLYEASTTIQDIDGNEDNDEPISTNIKKPMNANSDLEMTALESSLQSTERPTTLVDLSSESITNATGKYVITNRKRVNVNLSSIKELCEEVDNSLHTELTNIFANLTYVGVVDFERRLAAIQHDLKLFLVDYGALTYELFYQIGLTDFSNFGKIYLQVDNTETLKLDNILSIFDNIEQQEKLNIIDQMWTMKDMLSEYFSIELTTVEPEREFKLENVIITSLPLLLKGYNPPLSKLGYFIYRLGTKVNWEDEKQCLSDIIRQVALLYIPETINESGNDIETNGHTPGDENNDLDLNRVKKCAEMASLLEHVIFPSIKRRLLASNKLLQDIVEIANLPGLYKVFERC